MSDTLPIQHRSAIRGAPRGVTETTPAVQRLSEVAASTGESPVWDERRRVLYWVDIDGYKLLRWSMQDGRTHTWHFDREVCSLGLTDGDGLVLALRDGVFLFDPSSEALTLLVRPEFDSATQRLNDGKVGPDGAFWVGAMDERAEKHAVAALYRVSADGRCAAVGRRVKVSNGLAFSPDGQWVYHSDSRGGKIFRYPFDRQNETLGAAQDWVEMLPDWGRPDGAAVDQQGAYWSCGIDAGRINRFSAEGQLLEAFSLPLSHPTMCCFGGVDMKTLFVTSLQPATGKTAMKYPEAGHLLCLRTTVAGLPAHRFALRSSDA